MLRIFLALALWTAFDAFGDDILAKCRAAEKPADCARAAGHAHVIKKVSFWREALARPVEDRIAVGPPELVEFLMLDNVANGFPNEARAAPLDPAFLADVRRAMQEIPDAVKHRLAGRLAGIYFIEDIGGTGFSDETLGEDGKAAAGFVILDPVVLSRRTANEWATWKESSPFKPDAAWKLEARIEDGTRNDRVHAIQYILLHELGHVLSLGSNAHPSWTIPVKAYGPAEAYPFFNLSWVVAGDRWTSRFEEQFPQRKDVRFYFGAKLAGDAMLPVYEALEKTHFPTLYAATHFGDDFAEALASYVHVELMKQPYEIRIVHDGRVAKSYGPCWHEARCAAKKAYLEKFLAGS